MPQERHFDKHAEEGVAFGRLWVISLTRAQVAADWLQLSLTGALLLLPGRE